jgi:hypothetical protein
VGKVKEQHSAPADYDLALHRQLVDMLKQMRLDKDETDEQYSADKEDN